MSEEKQGVYRYTCDCGRMGTLRGIFVATKAEVDAAIGRKVYFGEVLGKHSEVQGTIDQDEIVLLTDDEAFVTKFLEYDCASGHNPLSHLCCRKCDYQEYDCQCVENQ